MKKCIVSSIITFLVVLSVTIGSSSVCSATPNKVDYDDDGKTDISVFRPSSGTWYIKNSSNGTQSVVIYGILGDKPVPGDYDGDGKTDISVFRPSNGTWYIKNSSNGTQSDVIYGINGDKPVPGDYDGDGKTDRAVFRPSNGTWYIMNSSDGIQSVVIYGIDGDNPVPGDYDGDGKNDRAVFRPSIGTWYIMNSSSGTQSVLNLGIDGDIPAPGDYDGDGKTDRAVFRPSIGTWFIMNSSNDTQSVLNLGTGGDIPVPGDYDGDGKTDAAVFRPSSGTWYIMNSSTSSMQIVQYGLPTDVPLTTSVSIVSPGYSTARQITVSGESGAAAGAVATLTIDTRSLITGGLLRPDRNDLRLVYNNQEIDRVLTDTGTVMFRVQAPIAINGTDSGYYLYYGNPSELTSPLSNRANVYPFYADGSSTAPFIVSGTAPIIEAMPKPEFLKFSNNPVLRRTPDFGDWEECERSQYSLV